MEGQRRRHLDAHRSGVGLRLHVGQYQLLGHRQPEQQPVGGRGQSLRYLAVQPLDHPGDPELLQGGDGWRNAANGLANFYRTGQPGFPPLRRHPGRARTPDAPTHLLPGQQPHHPPGVHLAGQRQRQGHPADHLLSGRDRHLRPAPAARPLQPGASIRGAHHARPHRLGRHPRRKRGPRSGAHRCPAVAAGHPIWGQHPNRRRTAGQPDRPIPCNPRRPARFWPGHHRPAPQPHQPHPPGPAGPHLHWRRRHALARQQLHRVLRRGPGHPVY